MFGGWSPGPGGQKGTKRAPPGHSASRYHTRQMTQRRKTVYFVDAREQWTTMALMQMFDDSPPVWDPAYPQEERVRLRCNACNAVLGRVRYHDGMAHGAHVPVYLADVQTTVVNPDARPIEVASTTIVLSPLTIDLYGLLQMSTDPNRLGLLDERARAPVEPC